MTTSTLSRAEYLKAYRKANAEKNRTWAKASYKANREKADARTKAYYAANPEKRASLCKAYRDANPQANALDIMASKCKVSNHEIRGLAPQELIEVKLLQLQLHRLIHARTEAS